MLDPELLFDRILSVDDVAGLHAAGVAIADYFAVESFEIAYRIDDAPHILARVGAPLPPYEAHMAGVAEDDGLWSFVFGETDGALLRVRFRDGMLTPGQIGGIERAARCLRPAVLRILDQERARVLGRQLAILRDQARQAERLKEEFLSNLSHELRTPLTAILGFSEILIEKGAVQGAPSECAARIHQNGERLLKLLNRLLQLAKLESDRFNVHWAQVDVVAAIAESVAAVRGAAVAKGLTVALEVPELPPVMADARILRDALACVLENAVKFTDQGGLGLFARGDADHVYIVIRDTGRGIDATQLPFIFDAFWQGDGSLTRAVGGNGIGLTLASRLLSRIGGDVSVASLPGEGCTVTLQLQRQPLGSRTPSAPRRAPTEQYGLPF